MASPRSSLRVMMPADRPYSESLATSIASSTLPTVMIGAIGPNVSSRMTFMSRVTFVSIVGSKNRPLCLPPHEHLRALRDGIVDLVADLVELLLVDDRPDAVRISRGLPTLSFFVFCTNSR